MAIQENRKECLDELAITKAAAWAWYERGSWFEQESVRETDRIRKRSHTPRPSRYKIEAMKKEELNHELDSCNVSSHPLLGSESFNNSLFDIYELERISWEFGCYVDENHRRSVDDGGYGGRRIMNERGKGNRTGKKKHVGFWMRHGITCGSSSDVVEHALLAGGRRRRRNGARPVVGGMNNSRVATDHGGFSR